jgi:hypothetical protein
MMKKIVVLLVLAVFVITACKKVEDSSNNVTNYSYYYFEYNNGFNRIVKRNQNSQLLERVEVDTVNIELILVTVYDYYGVTEKHYVSLNEEGLAISQIDSVVDDEYIIAEYTYTYNADNYLINTLVSGTIYSDEYETVSQSIDASIECVVQDGNVVEEVHEKTFSGSNMEPFTEKEIYEYTFSNHENQYGLQGFMQPFYGEYNTHLIMTADYSYFLNDSLQSGGTYTYSYKQTEDFVNQVKIKYAPDDESFIYTDHYTYSELK